MRAPKDKNKRKNEILDVAQQLFNEKGYNQTTIEDILKESGIARGTLYYHFKSKEEILSEMINRKIDQNEAILKSIANDSSLSAIEKLVQTIQLLSQKEKIAENIYQDDNAELHHKSFKRSILRCSTVLSEIVEQGIASGEFSTPYPKECVELLFYASLLNNYKVFKWTQKEKQYKREAFFWLLEITLGISYEAKMKLHQLIQISKE